MQILSQIDLSDLHDMLAQHTNRYMKMLADGVTKQEFEQCRETIISIQAEIHSRKPRQSSARSGHPDLSFGSSYGN